jgi:coenzyme F420 hydrogenase subunit beta
MARSLDKEVRDRAQYGGVVTTLITYALEKELIDAAVVTKSADLVPQAVIVTNRREVLQSSGSNYMACPVLEAFNRSANGLAKKLGVVGVPCHIQALAKRRIAGFENKNNIGKLALTIGLFCTWALDRSFREFIAEKVLPAKVKKADIPPPPAGEFLIYSDEGCVSVPLTQVKKFTKQGCQYCVDMTAEYADISVGSVEGIENWNTIIIRSKIGSDFVEAAQKDGLLELKSLPAENISHLKEASLIKKKRAVTNIMEWTGSEHDLSYLRIEPEVLHSLFNGGASNPFVGAIK